MPIDCENGRVLIEGKVLADVHKYGKITVAEILKNSSNIGTWMIAQKLGFTPLESFLKQAGFKKSLDMKKGNLENLQKNFLLPEFSGLTALYL